MADVARLTIKVLGDTSEAKRKLEAISQQADRLSGRKIRIAIDVDDTGAKRKLDAITAQVDKLSKKSASISIDAKDQGAKQKILAISEEMNKLSHKAANVSIDAKDEGAKQKITAITEQMDRLSHKAANVSIKVDDAAAKAKIHEIAIEADKLTNASVTINVNDAEAKAKLRALQMQLNRIATMSPNIHINVDTAGASAKLRDVAIRADLATHDRTINIRVDKHGMAGISAMRRGVEGLGPAADGASRSIGGMGAAMGNMSGHSQLILLAIVGILAAIQAGAALLIATFGVALPAAFILVAALATKNGKKMNAVFADFGATVKSVISKDAKPMMDALAKGFAVTGRVLKAMSPLLKSAFAAAAPAVKPLLSSLTGLVRNILPGIITLMKASKPIWDAFAKGMSAMGRGLGQMFSNMSRAATPAAKAMYVALNGVGKVMATFGTMMAKIAGPGLAVFSAAFGLLAQLLVALTPALVATSAPVALLIRALGTGLSPLLIAIAPLLQAFTWAVAGLAMAFAQVIAHIPIPILTALIAYLILAKNATLLYAAAQGLVAIATRAWTVAQIVLNAVMAANPIILIIAGLVLLGTAIYFIATKTTWFQTAWSATWNFIKMIAMTVWGWLKVAFSAVTGFLAGRWGWLIAALPFGWILAIGMHWRQVWGAIKLVAATVWGWLKVAFSAVTSFLRGKWGWLIAFIGPVGWLIAIGMHWRQVWGAIKHVSAVIWGWIRSAWHACVTAISSFTSASMGHIRSVWNAAWNWIKHVASSIWGWLRNAWHACVTAITNFTHSFLGHMRGVWNAAWNWIKHVASSIWGWLRNAWHACVTAITNTTHAFIGHIKGVWSAMWNAVKHLAGSAWSWLKNTAHSFGSAFVAAFRAIKSGVSKVWGSLKSIFKAPISFFVNTVYDKGILPVWNATAGKVGLGKMKPAHFASGGHVQGPGSGTSDSIPAMLSHGEFVMNAKAVDSIGVSNLHAMNAGAGPGANRASITPSGVPGFKGGGTADGGKYSTSQIPGHKGGSKDPRITKALGGAAGFVKNWGTGIAAKAFKFLWNHTVSPLANHIPGSSGQWSKGIRSVPDKIRDKAASFISSADKKAMATAGSSTWKGGGSLGKWIAEARKYVSIPDSWLGPLHTLIMRESGGNPNAQNNWDSNAKAGHPSQGLMQTIAPTFAHYRDSRLPNNMKNPVANIVAGINYIRSRYGSIFNVQQAVGSSPKGYAIGGTARGLSLVGERGPELINAGSASRVSSNAETQRLIASAGGGSGDVYNVTIQVAGNTLAGRRELEDAVVQGINDAQKKGRLKRTV